MVLCWQAQAKIEIHKNSKSLAKAIDTCKPMFLQTSSRRVGSSQKNYNIFEEK